MTTLHDDEVPVTDALVRGLVRAQCPRWADLPLRRLPAAGTDNVIYRLGTDLVLRLPRTAEAAGRVAKEQRWLPRIASHLPLPVPRPLFAGRPAGDYPFAWTVLAWLPGAPADVAGPPLDAAHAAESLAAFIAALHALAVAEALPPGPHNFFRGVPLADRDDEVRTALADLSPRMDTGPATAAWQALLRTPPWPGPPCWIHGDLLPGNLLVERGRIVAILDFGGLGTGDPACDLLPAWSLLSAPARQRFRDGLGVDTDTWRRGMGWALSVGLIALPYYRTRDPAFARLAERMIAEVLAAWPLDLREGPHPG